MQRIGQITVFVIVGIVLVTIIGASLLFSNEHSVRNPTSNPLLPQLKSITTQCLSETGKEAVIFISEQGGFFRLPASSDNILQPPHYLTGNKQNVPSLQVFEQNIAEYLKQELPLCLDRTLPPEVLSGPANTKAIIQRDGVTFVAEITFRTPTQQVQIALIEEAVTLPSRLFLLQEVAKEVVSVQTGQNAICLSCIANLGASNNLSVVIGRQDNDDLLVQIIDRPNSNHYIAPANFAVDKPVILLFLMKTDKEPTPQDSGVSR